LEQRLDCQEPAARGVSVHSDVDMEGRVVSKFRFGQQIGSGSFGLVYMGTNEQTGEDVAMKLEPIGSCQATLLNESKIYNSFIGGVGVPTVHWHGVEGDHNVIVMDLLGQSLEDLFNFCDRAFSLKTVIMLALQMLNRVEHVHARNVLHRDIKPENFVMGRKNNLLHIIDFGLAKKYRDPESRKHVPFRGGKSFVGTARYASVKTHLGIEQSRRDDLEALGYVLIYLLRGSLPWQGVRAATEFEVYEKIRKLKVSISAEELCAQLPAEFAMYMNYCKDLPFYDTPDYEHLRRLFRDLLFREGYQFDFVYDWTLKQAEELADVANAGEMLRQANSAQV